jgi:hypothetical protein
MTKPDHPPNNVAAISGRYVTDARIGSRELSAAADAPKETHSHCATWGQSAYTPFSCRCTIAGKEAG